MRLLTLAMAVLLLAAACSNSNGKQPSTDVYEVTLQGSATADGILVLSAPSRIEVEVPIGSTALDIALALRTQLQEKGHEVICTIDRGEQGFALLIKGRIEISSERSNLGGIGGAASQVIQRREVVESAVREYLRFLRENDASGLRRVTTDAFFGEAASDLGRGVSLVSLSAPSIGCRTASAVVEVALPGGEHRQDELQLVTETGLTWRVDGLRPLASWRAQP
ncbi:MAG: hypothetical protein IIC80_11475 [Chloroflexi bacterium]|nr:hypothetical protein [Chloroflexota bacterium]MCH8283239.1 hypothetical protein [Chloroflexota bacterium]